MKMIDYWHISLHSYWPVLWFNTCLFWQFDVPIGGITIGFSGCIDGGVRGHTVGGQIGGMSRELEHKGVISPFTHLHTQFPYEKVETVKRRNKR